MRTRFMLFALAGVGVSLCFNEHAYAGSAESRNGISTVVLDPYEPVVVPVHPDRTLTVMFPGSISAINGAGFTPNPDQVDGEYLFFHQPGSPFFSIIPISDAFSTVRPMPQRNLNVIFNGSVYVLRPLPVRTPNQALSVLNMIEPQPVVDERSHLAAQAEAEMLSRGTRVHVSEGRPRNAGNVVPVSVPRLLGMLDSLRMLHSFDQPTLEDALRVMPHMVVSLRKDDVTVHGDFSITTHMVVRNNDMRTLGFVVEVTNHHPEAVIEFIPDSFAVRAGNELYPSVISDLNRILHPQQSTLAYFVVGQGAHGQANRLDVTNDFRVILEVLSAN